MSIHPLEQNAAERERFHALAGTSERAAWRRAVEAVTDSLPSWAERKRNGLRPSFDAAEAVSRYRAGGVTLKQLAAQYGVTPQAVGHHVRRAANTNPSHRGKPCLTTPPALTAIMVRPASPGAPSTPCAPKSGRAAASPAQCAAP